MDDIYKELCSDYRIVKTKYEYSQQKYNKLQPEVYNEIIKDILRPHIDNFNNDYPDNIREIIINNIKKYKIYLDYIYKKGCKYIQEGRNVDDIIIRFNKKSGVNDFMTDIFNSIFLWVKSLHIFDSIDTGDIDIDEEEQPLLIEKFIPRKNQQEAFDILYEKGLETGIHCQATGAGKSFIILKYIDYCINNYKCAKIILFTERVNILLDLFDFKNDKPNNKKIQLWKELGIADLTNIDIINRVTIKKNDWANKLIESKKHTLLVINRAYLTKKIIYEKLGKKHLNLILHDECHNTTSKLCHSFLKYCKNIKVHIVGFSATPLRTGKNDLPLLREIYGSTLNLLTNFNMIEAINNNLILPPQFYWYELKEEWFKKHKDGRRKKLGIYDKEYTVVIQLLNKIVDKMPNKKLVAWCGKIDMARKWKEIFEEKNKLTNLSDFKFYIDTSMKKDNDYNEFKNSDGKCILFCATKHREGSDIKRLDGCIFLDRVKNRSSIPFIQSIGRVLRIDITNPNKDCGFIIDCIYSSDTNINFTDKIIDYYLCLENVSKEMNEFKTKTDKLVELRQFVTFEEDRERVKVNIGSKHIYINLNTVKWTRIKNDYENNLERKLKVSLESSFRIKGKILKNIFGFHKNTDFYNEYVNIPDDMKEKYNLPDIDEEEYIKIFNKNSWYNLLNIKHNFYQDYRNILEYIKENDIKIKNIKKDWIKLCKLNERIPHYPYNVWSNFSYDVFINKRSRTKFI